MSLHESIAARRASRLSGLWLPDLQQAPWRGTSASDEVCPSCGTHFGSDDAAGGNVIRRRDVYVDLRARWKSKGCPWFLQGTKPSGWNPIRQLRRVEGSG